MSIIVGKIYAEWCGHCQRLEPEWKQMKEKLNENKNIEFVEIEEQNLDKLDELNEKNKERFHGQKVTYEGFPTIFKIVDGNPTYYNGERDADKMYQWVITKGGRRRKTYKRKSRKSVTRKNRKSKNIFSLFRWK
jgi:thiol-disulfide isomerase/thioredoxin